MTTHLRWEGPFFSNGSLAQVNREIVCGLDGRAGLELSVRSGERASATVAWDAERAARLRALERVESAPDVVVRHRWPMIPHPPATGGWVIMQPWEFGALPRAWSEPMSFGADQVWVYSGFNRQCYVESGVPEDRIRVVPLGVNPVMLGEPGATPFPLKTRKRFRFLFVGGTILRKGIDLLLDSYTRAFGPDDDVCLVIKDFGTDSFYRGQTQGELIAELQSNPRKPEIEYLTGDLTPEELRDLYHACDCLVHPYRGEGFGLPIAEAMACGLPVIVPDQGGASDFCTAESAVLVPSRRVMIPAALAASLNTVGAPWWVEVDLGDLRARMRAAYEDPGSLADTARAGQRLIRSRFTWERAADAAERAVRELAETPVSEGDSRDRLHRARVEAGAQRYQLGDVEGALRHFALARETRADPDVLYNLSSLLLQRGDHPTALRLLREAVERLAVADDPEGYADAAVLLAVALRAAGDGDGALTVLRRAASAAPDHAALRHGVSLGSQAAPRPSIDPARPSIHWLAPMFNGTGYADESRHFLLGLHRSGGAEIRLDAHDAVKDHKLLPREDFEVLESYTRRPARRVDVEFQHSPPSGFRPPQAPLSVARTMFETDRIPEEWADWCNRFTEVWVPTEFNRETFARAGVVRDKLRVVHGSLDPEKFRLDRYPRVKLGSRKAFTFLSVFDFTPRKGWDILLRAFFEEFTASEPVALVVKVVSSFGVKQGPSPEERVRDFIRRHGFQRLPQYTLIHEYYSDQALRSLYRSCDAFVLPSRGEGWGRPYMEAMAFGLPTIGTRWSGNLEFMNDTNSYLIDIDGLEPCEATWPEMPFYAGQQWAVPSLASTRRLLRQVFEHREEAQARGARAREQLLSDFAMEPVADRMRGEFARLVGEAYPAARPAASPLAIAV